MALIVCPECGKEVSSTATVCPHCGYNISEYVIEQQYNNEVSRLMNKVLPVEFECPEPRMKVCIKCGKPYYLKGQLTGKPVCSCSFFGKPYPGVEVDYPQYEEKRNELGAQKYVFEKLVVPRKIGDIESEEYKLHVESLYNQIKALSNLSGFVVKDLPPDPKYYGMDSEMLKKEEDSKRQAYIVDNLQRRINEEVKTKRKGLILAIVLTVLSTICFLVEPLLLLAIIFGAAAVVFWWMLYKSRGSVEQMEQDLYTARTNLKKYDQITGLRSRGLAESAQKEMDRGHPKCPICGSRNTARITTLNRAISVSAVGLASSKIGMQYECKNCKHKW